MIMRIKNFICILILIFSSLFTAQGQKRYSLEECISIALKNNLELRSSKIREQSATINFKQSKANLLPSMNGNYNIGVNNGRSIDPFTNDFINQKLTFSNANLNLDAVIFNGFRLLNSVKQQKMNAKAATMEVEQEKQNLVLSVTLAYLQVLNSRDVLQLNEQRLTATKNQLKIQKDLYDEGRSNPADYTDLLGQKAIDETSILSSQIALNNAKLSLTRLLNFDEEIDVDANAVLLNLGEYNLTSEEVYQHALSGLATFKARELRVEAAKKGMNVARAQHIPEVSVFGRVNTNYSSAAETFTQVGSSIIETGDFVTINSQNVPVLREQNTFSAKQIPYLDQFENNLNSVMGVSVRIPLFNGFRAKNNVALERTQIEIKNTIKQVHFDMEAAFARYQSFQKQVEASKDLFR